MILLVIPGKPIPYKSPRVYQNATFNPRYQEKKQVQDEIRSQHNDPLLSGPVCVDYIFRFSIPVSYSKRKRKEIEDGTLYPTHKYDLSNLAKFYDDCLIDTLIVDDGLIIQERLNKEYGDKEETIIKIWEMALDD